MAEQNPEGEQVTRTEVRPGLVMVKRRTLMPDGRYLLYFDFERPGFAPQDGETATPGAD
jgi:hypothetical protein